MAAVRGRYEGAHSHPIGAANLIYTRIPDTTKKTIEQLLREGVRPDVVLARVSGNVHTEQNLEALHGHAPRRKEFIKAADICRIEKKIESESISLDADDGKSTLKWVEHLKSIDMLLFFKASGDRPPADSEPAEDVFALGIQTPYQRKCFRAWGKDFAGLDATHNTTYYKGFLLFTLIVCDWHGHGMPVAWMISSNGTGNTIDYFLIHIRLRSPEIDPRRFMSDRDPAQLGWIVICYPISQLFLCWWHVPHTWQQHIVIAHFPELWEKLKTWYRITDVDEFWACWEEIKELSTPSIIKYFETYWLPDDWVPLWSGVYRKDRTVYEQGDTNMLVEAWHHILKTGHMDGKCNRHVDQLIHTLINVAIPHYIAKHRAQQFRFHGPDLGLQARNNIHERARDMPANSIREIDTGRIFIMQSQSSPGREYTVNLESYTCDCLSFPNISFCKHICGVENHFPDLVAPGSFSPPLQPWDNDSPDTIQAPSPEQATDQPRSKALVRPVPVPPTVSDNNKLLLHFIVDQLQHLQRTDTVLPPPLTQSLRQLNSDLIEANQDLAPTILPRAVVRVVPNESTRWPDTLEVMGAKRKRGKERVHTDPYSGGQASGKWAKPDAREPKRAKTTLAMTPPNVAAAAESSSAESFPPSSASPSVSQENFASGLLDLPPSFENFPNPDSTLTMRTEPEDASKTPQMLLIEALTLYNARFPNGIPDPQPTQSYYREDFAYVAPSTSMRSYYR